MNKQQKKLLYYNLGDKLITFLEDAILFKDDFNINADSMTNGSISNSEMCLSYIVLNENEMMYVYRDNEGMICLDTAFLDKSFINYEGVSYFGYDMFEGKSLDYAQSVNSKLCLKKKSKQYHI